MPSNAERLRKLYEQFSPDDRVLIPIFADPDSIGSAMAMKRLLWRKVSGVTISHINEVKRPDNLALIRLLGVNLVPFERVNPGDFTKFAIVDSQPNHHKSFAAFNYSVIVDHHPLTGAAAPFTDIRPQYGATSSIMTEYLKAARIKPSMMLATGLFYGIKTDTSNFERQTLPEDLRAFQYLFHFINVTLARKIEYSEITIDFLKYYQIALENKCIVKNRVYVTLGPVENPDICVLIADFFMKIARIDWTFIAGLYSDRLVIIIRNNGIRKDAGRLAARGFGDIGSAGGHKSTARAEITFGNLKNLVDFRDPRRLLRWIIKRTH